MFLLKKAARSLRFIGAYMLANTQAAMEYRVSFWVQIITMIANDSLWLFFWWTYFHQFPPKHVNLNRCAIFFCAVQSWITSTEHYATRYS